MVNEMELQDRELDRVFMALSDVSRRRMVAALAATGEMSVSGAASGLDLTAPAVTKHVKVLESAGLVRRRVVGRRHLLSLESDRLRLAEDWIDRYRTLWTASVDRLAALAEDLEAQG